MNRTSRLIAGLTLAFTLIPVSLVAQNSDKKSAETQQIADRLHALAHQPDYSTFVFKTYYLKNVSQQNDANEILIALRNMVQPSVRIYLVASQNAIELFAPLDQQALAQKIIADLDRPKKSYRLTFTLAESDGGKRIGVQHFAVVAVSGQRTVLKQGSKIPVMTGSSTNGGPAQYQYLDVGMNFDLTLSYTPGGLYLKSSVEQSSISDEHMSGALSSEPIVRQTVLEGSSAITPGKPLTLGSIDITGSTRHVDIEVISEPIS